VLVIYKERGLSYDEDWKHGFKQVGGVLQDWEEEADFHDLTVILHSLTAQWGRIPDWIYQQAQKRKGKLVLFLGNEFKKIKEKKELAVQLGADVIATQLCKEDAARLYGHPVIEVPHALNSDFFFLRTQPKYRPFDIGVRGNEYPAFLGDSDRNNIHDPEAWGGLKHDVIPGARNTVGRQAWAELLNSWRAMPSCEGGMVGGKCITSRHFDAIGCFTTLVMYPGKYNGILSEQNYIRLEKDHSNLEDVKKKILDKDYCERIARETRGMLLDCHTHKARAQLVKDWACR
jgi:hypothetical protein